MEPVARLLRESCLGANPRYFAGKTTIKRELLLEGRFEITGFFQQNWGGSVDDTNSPQLQDDLSPNNPGTFPHRLTQEGPRTMTVHSILRCLFVPVLAVALAASPAVTSVAQDTPPAETATEQAEEVASAAEEPDVEQPAEDAPAAAASTGDGRPEWMVSIDDAFGSWVVGPAASVIFYDFGTGPKELADGSIQPGWLTSEAAPNGTSIPFVVVWLLFGAIFLTLRMRFINFRAFFHAIRLTKGDYDDPSEPGEVSHFQALSAALSATVGLGNIAGVAIAIGTGGPGATVWIILIGLLGMTAKFTECTLGQLYRVKDHEGHVLGGPMRYLRYGLEEMGLGLLGRILAVSFMILCIGASFGGGNSFQIGQSLEAIRGDIPLLQEMPWLYGIVMAVLVGAVIVGGIKSIGAVAGKIVPFMCFAYVLACLFILFANVAKLPDAVMTIVTSAFNPDAIYGGFLGVLVIGIKRAVFSNEAGVGSAAIAHSAAKTDEPVSEGIVALLEPFIDTVVVCTITALVVVVTGAYMAPEMAGPIAASNGSAVTLHAFVTGGYDWFRYILYLSVVLFAYSTCISWSYYGERCWVQLFGTGTSLVYKGLFLLFTFLGSVVTRGNILDFSDLMILGMCLPNLLGVFLLSGLVKRKLDEYWDKLQRGEIQTYKDMLASGSTHPHVDMKTDETV